MHAVGDTTDTHTVLSNCPIFTVDDKENIRYHTGVPWLLQGCICVDGSCRKCNSSKKMTLESYKEYQNTCAEYDQLLFSSSREEVFTNEQGKSFLTFPPIYSKTLDSCVEKVLDKLSEELNGVIVHNYDVVKNVELFNINSVDLRKRLGIDRLGNYMHRFLWFEQSGNIVNVRVCDSDDVESIKEQLIYCREDLKLLIYLYQADLARAGICVTFLLVAKNVTKDVLKDICEDCVDHVVSNENWHNKTVLSEFWRNIERKKPNSKSGTLASVRRVISRIVASMAGDHSECQAFLPLLRGDPYDTLSSLMLTRSQLEVIQSTSKGKIVRGCYGSGKSIVGRIMFRLYANLSSDMFDKTIYVYYIVWDPWSLISVSVEHLEKRFIEKKKLEDKNLVIRIMDIGEVLQMLNINKEVPLPYLLEELNNHHKNALVYSVVDEYTPKDPQEFESLKLLQNIESTVLVQPMQNYILNEENAEMEIFTLCQSLRTTEQVSNLLKMSQELLEQEPIEYTKPTHEDTFMDAATEVSSFATATGPLSISKGESCSGDTEEDEETKKSNKTHPEQSSIKYSFGLENCVQKYFDNGSSNRKIHLQFQYSKIEHLGHRIYEYKIPEFYQWPEYNSITIDGLPTLAVVINLNSIFLRLLRRSSVVVLCSNKKKRNIVINSLKHLRPPTENLTKLEMYNRHKIKVLSIAEENIIQYTPFLDNPTIPPTKEEKLNVHNQLQKNRKHIMITDIRGYRGLESKNVIVMIDDNEYHGKQFVAESLSRCISNELYFVNIAKKSMEESSNKQTLQQIIKHWESELLINTLQPSLSKETFTIWKSILKTSTNVEYTTKDDDHSNLIDWRQYVYCVF